MMFPDQQEPEPEPRGRGLYKRDGEQLLFAEHHVVSPAYSVYVATYTAPVGGWTLFENEAAAEEGLPQ